MAVINLSNTLPDQESLKGQLQTALADKQSWRDLLPTQTGQTIIDFIAAVGALNQGKALRYAQDAFAETAISERALYAIADLQGLRLSRKSAAAITVNMTYNRPLPSDPATVTLGAFTQFQGAGTYWYTNTPYVINNGATVSITLYQGYVVEQTLAGLGSDYQTFITVEKDFTVSDGDVFVWINATPLTKTRQGLWLHKGQPAFLERTTPNGELKIQFGNDYYGSKPAVTDIVRIVYAVTSGYDGNNIQALGQQLAQSNNIISGVTFEITSNSSGGASQQEANVYKRISSSNFGAFGSAVTRSQYVSQALAYPGVLDAKMFSQRELDPSNVQYMNTIKTVLITSSAWSLAQQQAFIDTMQAETMYSTKFYLVPAVSIPRTMKVKLYCYSYANLDDCRSSATNAIYGLFAPKQGILQYDHMLSDITDEVLKSNSGIEAIDIITPTQNMQASGKPVPTPTATLVAGGTLGDAVYTYGIIAYDGRGNTVPVNKVVIQVAGGSNRSVKLDWLAYPEAQAYHVVGRVGGSLGVLASLSGSTLTWTDNGSAVISGLPIPTAASYPVLYNDLTSLTVSAEYSTRRI